MTTSTPTGNHRNDQSDGRNEAREFLAQADAGQIKTITKAIVNMEQQRRRDRLPNASASLTTAPDGAEWIGEWDEQHGDRFFRYPSTEVGNVEVYVGGIQSQDGFTDCGVNVVVRFGVPGSFSMAESEMTLEQARELADKILAAVELASGTNTPLPTAGAAITARGGARLAV